MEYFFFFPVLLILVHHLDAYSFYPPVCIKMLQAESITEKAPSIVKFSVGFFFYHWNTDVNHKLWSNSYF